MNRISFSSSKSLPNKLHYWVISAQNRLDNDESNQIFIIACILQMSQDWDKHIKNLVGG